MTGAASTRHALAALRRGWYLGEETFRDRLLDLVEKAKGVKPVSVARRVARKGITVKRTPLASCGNLRRILDCR